MTRAADQSAEAAAIRHVPQDGAVRESIRSGARDIAGGLSRARPLTRGELESAGRTLLGELGLPERYLGFAMVAVDNEFWREQFAAVPTSERLLLLPHCLRDSAGCRGTYDAVGLNCAGCGSCLIPELAREAEALGYRVLVAEGTPAVVQIVLDGDTEAVLGVACLESLDKAFERVIELGIPHAAVPLLKDGCVDTVAELDLVRELVVASSGPAAERTRVYVPLLRASREVFSDGLLTGLLAPLLSAAAHGEAGSFGETEAIAVEWLGAGGKRFRPFITLAAYAAMTRGASALEPRAKLEGVFSDAVKRAAVAIEVLHKASLVHDDIEDDDAMRYGRETLHEHHGVPVAINVGDYLIGLGYRLIASGAAELGEGAAADIVSALSSAHVKLARGQGAELAERRKRPCEWSPEAMQAIYAMKTAPAFEVAFYTGLRMAGPAEGFAEALERYSRYLGVAYQVRNDLEDYDPGNASRQADEAALTGARPTMLRAFAAAESLGAAEERLSRLESSDMEVRERQAAVRGLYEEFGIFEKARGFIGACRERALEQADGVGHDVLAELLRFVVRTVL